jgi:hypothetical protein
MKMGERRDLRDLLKDTDFTQKRIIDDLAGSDTASDYPERGFAGDMKRSEGGDFIKNIFIGFLLVGIVVGSFWISFLVGKKVLVPPVKTLPTFEFPVPKAISKLEIERAAPAKEEPEIKEREIKAVETKASLPKPVTAAKMSAAKNIISSKKTGTVAPAVKTSIKTPVAKTTGIKYFKVIVGTYRTAAEANGMVISLKGKGFQSYAKAMSGLYRVQAGAFDKKEKSSPLMAKLTSQGFTPTLIIE